MLNDALGGRCAYYFHSVDKKTDLERLNGFLKITQLINCQSYKPNSIFLIIKSMFLSLTLWVPWVRRWLLRKVILDLNIGFTIISCVTLGKSFNLNSSQLLQTKIWENNSPESLWWFQGLIHIKCLEKYLCNSNHSKILALILLLVMKSIHRWGPTTWRLPQHPSPHHRSKPTSTCSYEKLLFRKPNLHPSPSFSSL